MTSRFKERFIYRPHLAVLIVLVVIAAVLLFNFTYLPAEERPGVPDAVPAVVTEVLSERETTSPATGRPAKVQDLVARADFGQGEREVRVLNDFVPVKESTRIYLNRPTTDLPDELETFYVVQVQKERGLYVLLLLFVILAVAISRWKGVRALIGLFFSLSIVFAFIIPFIIRGYDPILVGITGAVVILVVSLYASHGFTRKSVAALLGIFLALVAVALLAQASVHVLHFSGYTGEESFYLNYNEGQPAINLLGLVIAGIIIAGIGILDDVAITQASTVFALGSVQKGLRGIKLFKKAMEVGEDHISAVINTLVLAYVGAGLPLLLLVTINQFSLDFVISNDRVAEEIVRTLVSSMGLLLAVPLTTLIAVWLLPKERLKGENIHLH